MKMRSQSALEFLTTYSYAFLIIAVAISVLFFYVTLPKSTIPAQCYFYSGFTCADSEFVINSAGVGQLVVVVQDGAIGIINTTSFNAVMNFQNSTHGYCVPRFTAPGQTMYCVANFSFTPELTSTYTGTFKILADFCTAGTANLTDTSCPAATNYTYAGAIRTQVTNASSAISTIKTDYFPITITNAQSNYTPVPLQQQISFAGNNAMFAPYDTNSLSNIRFYYQGRELESWCQASCSNTVSTNAVFWVRLPAAIAPGASITVDMYFLPSFVGFDHFGGEAPQLTTTYAQYDNGAGVFNFYDNFYGNTLSALWSSTGNVGVSNGLLLGQTTAGVAKIKSSYATLKPPYIVNSYVNLPSSSTIPDLFDINFTTIGNSVAQYVASISYSGANKYYMLVNPSNTAGVYTALASGQYGAGIYTNDTVYIGGNRSQMTGMSVGTSTNTIGPLGFNYPLYSFGLSTSGGPIKVGYVFVRGYPPNDIMPTVAFATKVRSLP